MSDRVRLIRALSPILGLMFDGFCQVCSRLAIYEKVRKNSLSAQFSVERYIVLIITSVASRLHHQVVLNTKSSSSPSRSHYQAVFITKSFSSSRSHQVVVIIKSSSSSSRRYHQAVLIIKSIYQVNLQVNLSSQSIKSTYQVILLSDRIKHS